MGNYYYTVDVLFEIYLNGFFVKDLDKKTSFCYNKNELEWRNW